jgi:hypothetical protein
LLVGSVAPVRLELEERLVLSMIEFFRSVSSRINIGRFEKSLELSILGGATDMLREYEKISKNITDKLLVQDSELLPSVVPVGAPWQQIHLLARKQKKVYIELFQLTPVKLTFRLFISNVLWLLLQEMYIIIILPLTTMFYIIVLRAHLGSIGLKVVQTPA